MICWIHTKNVVVFIATAYYRLISFFRARLTDTLTVEAARARTKTTTAAATRRKTTPAWKISSEIFVPHWTTRETFGSSCLTMCVEITRRKMAEISGRDTVTRMGTVGTGTMPGGIPRPWSVTDSWCKNAIQRCMWTSTGQISISMNKFWRSNWLPGNWRARIRDKMWSGQLLPTIVSLKFVFLWAKRGRLSFSCKPFSFWP